MEIMPSGMKQNRQILRPVGCLGLGVGVALMLGCVSDQDSGLSQVNLKDPRSADPFDVVDCLLPGQIRQPGDLCDRTPSHQNHGGVLCNPGRRVRGLGPRSKCG